LFLYFLYYYLMAISDLFELFNFGPHGDGI